MDLLSRFLRYVRIDTMSDPASDSVPSTKKQLELAKLLQAELIEAGLPDVFLDETGVLYAKLPATPGREREKTMALLAHFDTSPDLSGRNVKPQIIEDYDGSDIPFPRYPKPLSPKEFPDLLTHVGETLIVTEGDTLLGADDKAGIAEIMEAIRLVRERNASHGPLAIAFTPDEEIGRGVDHFDLARLAADYAYTVDGGRIDEIQYENFNAASLQVNVQGFNIHPGTAKNRMKNASSIAMEFDRLLPAAERPEFTEHREGFFHLSRMNGSEESATLSYIIRDHDWSLFEQRKSTAREAAKFLNKRYGDRTVRLTIKDTYYNMKEKILPKIWIVERAKEAMRKAGITPGATPIRGGTDGSQLSLMGLPCPNLPTGGANGHGRFEYISLQDMEKVSEMLFHLITAEESN